MIIVPLLHPRDPRGLLFLNTQLKNALSVGLQLLTVSLPGLRTPLGLELLTLELLTPVSAAVLMT